MQIISVDIENANSPRAKACVRPHICQGKPMAVPHRTPIRIKMPLNVSKSPLLNRLYGSNCLKLTTSALDMPNRHGGSPAALAPSGKSASKRRCGNKCSHRPTSSRSATAGESEPELQCVCITESEASERPASSLANTFGVGRIGWLDRGFIKVKLAHVKKKRQSERYANQESTDNRDPKSPHTEAASLCKNEDPEHQ